MSPQHTKPENGDDGCRRIRRRDGDDDTMDAVVVDTVAMKYVNVHGAIVETSRAILLSFHRYHWYIEPLVP